jgi:hypothetical protein
MSGVLDVTKQHHSIVMCSEQSAVVTPCSFGLSATSQQYFSLRINQPPPTSQQYFSLKTNQHQPSSTSRTNMLLNPGPSVTNYRGSDLLDRLSTKDDDNA